MVVEDRERLKEDGRIPGKRIRSVGPERASDQRTITTADGIGDVRIATDRIACGWDWVKYIVREALYHIGSGGGHDTTQRRPAKTSRLWKNGNAALRENKEQNTRKREKMEEILSSYSPRGSRSSDGRSMRSRHLVRWMRNGRLR